MLCEVLTNINTDNITKLLLILLIFQGDKMEFLCDTNYILFPTSDNAQNKRLCFYIDNELVYDIVLKLDNASPDYKFPVDLKRFKGKKIKITSSPIVDICFDKAKKSALNMTANTDRWCILQPPRVG